MPREPYPDRFDVEHESSSNVCNLIEALVSLEVRVEAMYTVETKWFSTIFKELTEIKERIDALERRQQDTE